MKSPTQKRVLSTILILLTFVATAFVLAPVQRALHEQMESLHRALITEIENLLNRSVSYARITPSILSFVEIHELRVHGREYEREELLRVGRIRAHFRLRDLLGLGDEDAPLIQRLVINNTQLSLDLQRDDDLRHYVEELIRNRDTAHPVNLSGLRIDARNLDLSLISHEHMFRAQDLSLELHLSDEDLQFRLTSLMQYRRDLSHSMGSLAVSHGTEIPDVRAHIESAGSISRDMSSADFDLALNELFTPAVTVRAFRFGVQVDGGRVVIRNLPDIEPIDLHLAVDLQNSTANLRFQADNYNPDRTIILGDELKSQAPWLLSSLSGEGDLNFSVPELLPAEIGSPGELIEHITQEMDLSYSLDLALALSASHSPEQLSVMLRTDGNQRNANIHHLSVDSNYSFGRVSFRGNLDLLQQAPSGVMRFAQFRYRDSMVLNGSLNLSRVTPEQWNISSSRFSYGTALVYNLDLLLMHHDKQLDLQGLMFLDQLGTELVEFNAQLDLDRGPAVAATLELRNVSAESVFDIAQGLAPEQIGFAMPAELSNLRVDTRVNFSTEYGELQNFTAPYVSVFDVVNTDRYLSFSVFREDGGIEIEDLFLGYGGHILQGAATADFRPRGVVNFTADIVFEDEPYDFIGSFDPRFGLELESSRGIVLALWQDQHGVYRFAANSDDLELSLFPDDSVVSFDISGELRSLSDWELEIYRLSYAGVPSLTGTPSTVSVAGNLGPAGGVLSEVRLDDSVANLVGTGSLSYGFSSPFRIETAIELLGEVVGERYLLEIALYEGELDGRLEFSQASLRRLGRPNIRGSVDGEALIDGPVSVPRLHGLVTIQEGRYNSDPFFGSASFDISPQRLAVSDIELRYLRSLLTADQAVLNREDGSIRLHGRFQHETRRGTTELVIGVHGLFAENGEALVSPFEDNFRAAVQLRSAEVFQDQPNNEFELRFVRNDGTVFLDAGTEGELSGRIDRSGRFDLRARAPFPIAMVADGVLTDGQLEANLNRIEISVGRIAHLLDFVDFAVLDADITGSLRIVGPLNNPEFFGTLTADHVRSRLTFTPDEITAQRVYLVFQENEITLNRSQIRAGRGTAHATGGVVLNRWTPDDFRIEVETADEGGVRIRHDFDSVVVDGFGVGHLAVFGTLDLVTVQGEFTGRSTTITLSENLDPHRMGMPGNTDFIVDIRVRSGRGVEFYWPTLNFPLLRSFARAGEEIHIQWNSITGALSLVGSVGIQGGELFYFDRSFYIREGRIVFNETLESFDPMLSARAEVREMSERGPVTIYMIVDNSRLSQFTPRFESNPLLPENEIAELLGGQVFGQTVGEFAALSSAVLLSGEVATQLGIMRRFETRVRDTLGLDLLSVRTPVFQNLVRGAVEDRSEEIDAQAPSLGGYLNNTSVFLGKYLGTDVFLELLLRLQAVDRFDPNVREIGGLAVDTELTLEFQTPFFLLEWGFFPRDRNELFVRDNTFTFSWGFSY